MTLNNPLEQEDNTLQKIPEQVTNLPNPEVLIDIEMWRDAIRRDFPDCLFAAELGLSVAVQLLIKDISNPFGLVYIGAPSAGKTTTLSLFHGIPELTYATDSFTSAALVSHASNRSLADLKKIDMLPKIRNRLVLVPDLAPIFAERQENLLKNLGVLTRIFDGRGYESDSGVHGKRGYKGDYSFMFLACSTPIAPRVWKFMGSLGNRLYFYNFSLPDKNETELASLLIEDDYGEKLRWCQKVTRNLILSIWANNPGGTTWDKKSDSVELRKTISRFAMLLASLRGGIEEYDAGLEFITTNVEKPFRINQGLYNLCRAHALACGRKNIAPDDLEYCWKVVIGSAPRGRVLLVAAMVKNGGSLTTEE